MDRLRKLRNYYLCYRDCRDNGVDRRTALELGFGLWVYWPLNRRYRIVENPNKGIHPRGS